MLKKKNIFVYLVTLFIFSFIFFRCSGGNTKIAITQPSNDSKVESNCLVCGKVSNYTGGNVYVLVRPMDEYGWQVQRPPSEINEDGTWQTLCEIEDELWKEKYSELIAIVIIGELKEGQILDELPKDMIAKSPIIAVKN